MLRGTSVHSNELPAIHVVSQGFTSGCGGDVFSGPRIFHCVKLSYKDIQAQLRHTTQYESSQHSGDHMRGRKKRESQRQMKHLSFRCAKTSRGAVVSEETCDRGPSLREYMIRRLPMPRKAGGFNYKRWKYWNRCLYAPCLPIFPFSMN